MTHDSNGTPAPAANGHAAPTTAGGYLGPTCPVCGLPWAAHADLAPDGGPVACARHRPPDAPYSDRAAKIDAGERHAAAGRWRAANGGRG